MVLLESSQAARSSVPRVIQVGAKCSVNLFGFAWRNGAVRLRNYALTAVCVSSSMARLTGLGVRTSLNSVFRHQSCKGTPLFLSNFCRLGDVAAGLGQNFLNVLALELAN